MDHAANSQAKWKRLKNYKREGREREAVMMEYAKPDHRSFFPAFLLKQVRCNFRVRPVTPHTDFLIGGQLDKGEEV